MGYELLISGWGITIGITIALFITVRRVIEIERSMVMLVNELLAVRRISIRVENDPWGSIEASNPTEPNQRGSV